MPHFDRFDERVLMALIPGSNPSHCRVMQVHLLTDSHYCE